MTTLGEGGMLITDDPDLARRAYRFHHHGEDRRDGAYYQGERLYLHETLGYNFRMTEIQAAVGLVQLGRLEEYVRARRTNAHLLTRLLSDVPGVIPPYEPPGSEHAFYKYILRLDRRFLQVTASQFVQALSAEGIPCSRRYPTPLHQQPVFTGKNGFGKTQAPFVPPWYPGQVSYGAGLPNAEGLPGDLVRLSMSPTLREEDIVDMYRAVQKVVEAFRLS
jgi:perosamine synthetase